MSKQESLSFLGEWPSLTSDAGRLRARAYERPDGMRYLYFAPDFDSSVPPSTFGQTTRVAYRSHTGEALFLGMFITRGDRGQKLGEKLITHFADNVEHTGERFIGTGVIHKPIIALSLGRVGMQPMHTAFLAEILPKAASDQSDTPKIEILKNDLAPEAIVEGSAANRFYVVIPPEEAARYPINAPGMTVALHTPYLP